MDQKETEKTVGLALSLIGRAAGFAPRPPAAEVSSEGALSPGEGELLAAFRLARRHDLGHLAAHAILGEGLFPKESEVAGKLEGVRFTAVYRAERLTAECRRVSALFEEAQIRHIPLKGAVLRELYPEGWMRTSSDVDILVQGEDFDRASSVLAAHGYEAGERGGHDVVYKGPAGIPVELHFSLIEEGISGKIAEPLHRIWDSASPVAKGRWECRLSEGAFYYYHIAHMAKHVLHGGCGIRPFLDLLVMRGRIRMDRELLAAGGLLPLAEAAEALADAWFLGGDLSPTLRRLARFVLAGGVYGTVENRVVASKGKKGGRLGYILSRLFLPYDNLKEFFPILRRQKWLTPFCQVVRWFRMLGDGRMNRARRELAATGTADPEAVKDAELLMRELSL